MDKEFEKIEKTVNSKPVQRLNKPSDDNLSMKSPSMLQPKSQKDTISGVGLPTVQSQVSVDKNPFTFIEAALIEAKQKIEKMKATPQILETITDNDKKKKFLKAENKLLRENLKRMSDNVNVLIEKMSQESLKKKQAQSKRVQLGIHEGRTGGDVINNGAGGNGSGDNADGAGGNSVKMTSNTVALSAYGNNIPGGAGGRAGQETGGEVFQDEKGSQLQKGKGTGAGGAVGKGGLSG